MKLIWNTNINTTYVCNYKYTLLHFWVLANVILFFNKMFFFISYWLHLIDISVSNILYMLISIFQYS